MIIPQISPEWQERTGQLLGADAVKKLSEATVFVAGLGGVGGYALEVLARSGIGCLIIADADTVSPSNINRQLIALRSTVGNEKTELWQSRIADINPDADVILISEFLTPENIPGLIDKYKPDYVIDAIDTVAPKCMLIEACYRSRIPFISSMGAGGRLDPTLVRYGKLSETVEDGLARVLRQRLKSRLDINRVQVVWSKEAPRKGAVIEVNTSNKRTSFGTLATIPAIFGLYLANHVITRLIK